jgi:hypothetical protein
MSAPLATGTLADTVGTTHVVIAAGSNVIIDLIYFAPYSMTSTVAGGLVTVYFEDTAGSLLFQTLNINPGVGALAIAAPNILSISKGVVLPRGLGVQIRTLFSGANNLGALYSIFGTFVA